MKIEEQVNEHKEDENRQTGTRTDEKRRRIGSRTRGERTRPTKKQKHTHKKERAHAILFDHLMAPNGLRLSVAVTTANVCQGAQSRCFALIIG